MHTMVQRRVNHQQTGLRKIFIVAALFLIQSLGLAHAAEHEFETHDHQGVPCLVTTTVGHASDLDLATAQVIPICTASFDRPEAKMAVALAQPRLARPTSRAPPQY